MSTLKDFIATRFFAPALERRRGLDYRRYIPEVESVMQSILPEVRAHQEQRLSSILRSAQRLPFYAKRFQEAGLDPDGPFDWEAWRRLVPIDRGDVQALRDYLDGSGQLVGDYVKSATGGTTEAPIVFYLDRSAAERRHAATYYFNAQLGVVPGCRIVYLWGAAQDIPKLRGFKGYLEKNWFSRASFIPVTKLSKDDMFGYHAMLREQPPKLLQAYPSAMEIFSDFLIKNNLRLEVPVITCTAEALTTRQRGKIRDAFGIEPFEWYGAREAGRIATECDYHDGMHINCYGLLVETASDSGVGRILVTDLWNTLMPLVRYDIGDVAEIDESLCNCGSHAPRITNLLGRMADNFVKPDGTIVPGVVLTGRVPDGSEGVKSIQVVQKSLYRFVLRIVPGRDFSDETTKNLVVDGIRSVLGVGAEVEVEVEIVERIPREKSGKVRPCKNDMPAEELRKYF